MSFIFCCDNQTPYYNENYNMFSSCHALHTYYYLNFILYKASLQMKNGLGS